MIFYGVGVAYPVVTVTEAVLCPGRASGRRAVVDGVSGRSITHAALADEVAPASAALTDSGIGPGDVVGLHLPDGPEFAVALHALLAVGAVPLPLRAADPAELLDNAGMRVMIAGSGPADRLLTVARAAGVERVLGLGLGLGGRSGARTAAPNVRADPAHDTALAVRAGNGPPRVVRLTHAEVVAGLVRVAEAGLIGGDDIVLTALPFASAIGLNGVLNPVLRLGATVVALPEAGRHDLLRAIQDHRVTVAVLPPPLVEALARGRTATHFDLGSLRAVVAAGGPLAAEDARAAAARVGCPVRRAYGVAEAAGITHLNLWADEEGALDSVGRGLPGVSWRIVHPRTRAVQPSYRRGELCVRVPAAAEPARWVPTGDAAFADDHERVFILGRLGPRS
ncbi:class I adenylate-forming enzyme family protein [Actinomadura macra]|uniref:class I adenylate-forming enzyme family protein n=1 Tax=Actinomadura macra TaxID=46164 RepID=UPI000832F935|nr:AMP-binding protein [Actinomadura macra]